MAEYRIYKLVGGHIWQRPAELVCDSDDVAIVMARQMLNGHDIEVWEGPRCVVRISSAAAKTESEPPRPPGP